MDFFKSCTTNVHVVDALARIRYRRHEHTGDLVSESDRWLRLQHALALLRQHRVLCSVANDQLYVFENDDDDDDDPAPALDLFNAVEEDTLENASAKYSTEGALVRHVFLDAIEAGLAFSLAENASVVKVAPWTWIYHAVDEERDQDIAYAMKLHHRFSPDGGFYLLPEIYPTSLVSCDEDVQLGVPVIMAPSGALAKTVSSNAKAIVSNDNWKASVVRAMRGEGILLSDDVKWVAIQSSRYAATSAFLWPNELLFVHEQRSDHSVLPIDQGYNWRSWFTQSDDSMPFRNPLTCAEEWFKGSLARRQAEQAATVTGNPDPSDGNAQSMSGILGSDTDMISPPFTQRTADQQVAMAGIYPTPPDGLTQGLQNFQSQPAATPSVTQGEQSLSTADHLLTSDDTRSRSHDFTSSLDDRTFPLEQDELFGDSGEMEFGENDIGDADFSFFDEPDDEAAGDAIQDSEMQEAPNLDEHITLDNTEIADTSTSPINVDAQEKLEIGNSETSGELCTVPDIKSSNTPQDTTTGSIASLTAEFDGQLQPLEKPLSPFGIRERLLPPPVPASIAQVDSKDTTILRRNSTFSPIVFRENLNLDSRYADSGIAKEQTTSKTIQPSAPNISLPPTRKKSRLRRRKIEDDRASSSEDSESVEDSYESCSSDADENLPPQLPWDNRKRKRHLEPKSSALDNSLGSPWLDEIAGDHIMHPSHDQIVTMLKQQLSVEHGVEVLRSHVLPSEMQPVLDATLNLPPIKELYDLRKEDLVYIAQIIGEQAVTSVDVAVRMTSELAMPSLTCSHLAILVCKNAVKSAVEQLFPNGELCDIARLSLVREPQQSLRAFTNTGKGLQGQPRPPQRADSLMVGPDFFPLQPPYVRITRGADNWEMLSSCLSFWETLGIGPANGPKNVRAFCVFPNNTDLQGLVEQFIAELGTAYESCKLGSHVHLRNIDVKNELGIYENGMASVALDDDASMELAFRAYAHTCLQLGKALANISHNEADDTIVIYMVNPFQGNQARQHLCACFWMLFKAYRDHLPKTYRSQCGSDVVLQLIPISLVADFDVLVVPDARQMTTLAREVYDRCPPSSTTLAADHASTLPILAAPSVELAGAAPKRIGFQLVPDPPSDLLHEGSILHVAYARSSDQQWLTAAWMDNTGQYYSTTSFCLRGRSFVAGAEDVWERTKDIIAARQVTWRIFLVTPNAVDASISQCWRSFCSRARQQALCVTMLSVQTDPQIHLSSPDSHISSNNAQDQVFLTPASTPQAAAFTSSPDVNSHINAPLTPAPSETAVSLAENSPDAHLVDVTDESWGVMLSPKLTNLASNVGLANGALFQRGDTEARPGEVLPSLGVHLHWTIQIKPSGNVDEGSVKQAELTLREVLRMYRNLSLLTKARGINHGQTKLAPLPVAVAIRGTEWLNGMLPAVE